ncbi:MAG: hypothetical protein P8M25_20210 [Paracoccaceae bacterium]|nr:hypothetical protein [Paracoccaceae bacterium]
MDTYSKTSLVMLALIFYFCLALFLPQHKELHSEAGGCMHYTQISRNEPQPQIMLPADPMAQLSKTTPTEKLLTAPNYNYCFTINKRAIAACGTKKSLRTLL